MASAALALSGGVALAEVGVSGSAKMGLRYVDPDAAGSKSTLDKIAEFAISFSASGTTDGGLSFGADSGINVDNDIGSDNDTEVWISNGWGKLAMGSISEAEAGGVSDVGLDGLDADNAESPAQGSDADVRYDGTFGLATVAVSADLESDDDDWGISIGYSMDPVSFAVGIDSQDVISAGLGYSVGDISGKLSYRASGRNDSELAKLAASETDGTALADTVVGTRAGPLTDAHNANKANSIGADLTFAAGDMSVTVAYSKCSGTAIAANADVGTDSNASTIYPAATANAGCGNVVSGAGIGVSVDLGGGATLKGGIATSKSFGDAKTTKADLGIAMSF